MKIAHTADLHLGYRQYGFPQREQDFYNALGHVTQRAIDLKVDALILAGDCFDAPKPPAYAVRMLHHYVTQLQSHNIVVLGIDGNHDAAEGNWLHVCGILPLGEYVHPDGVRIVGLNAARATLFNKQVDALVTAGNKLDVLVIHQALGEFADFEAHDITAMDLAPKLSKLGVRYVAMGDIHDYKETVIGGVRFVYPGSTEMNALDEKQDKTFSVIDITPDNISTAFEPITIRPIIEIYMDDEKKLDTLLTQLEGEPLVVVWYEPEHKALAKRAEDILKNKNVMHLVRPLSKGSTGTMVEKLNKEGFERKGSLSQLKEAVKAYFEEDSEQYALVFQLLDAPTNVQYTVEQYLKSKGIEQ